MVGDTDWEFMFNTFSFGYAIGYQFVTTASGSPNGNYVGIAADACTNASVQVDNVKAWGISITNGEFVARPNAEFGLLEYNDATNIVVKENNFGQVHLTNCIFWGDKTTQHSARIYGNASVSFENCQFYIWNISAPAIYSEAGVIKVIGSNFKQTHAKHMDFSKGTQKAIVMGNSFNGTANITHDSSVQYVELGNL